VPTYCAAVCLTFALLSCKLAHRLLLLWGTRSHYSVWFFYRLRVFVIFELCGYTGQTDEWTDGRAIPVVRPTETAVQQAQMSTHCRHEIRPSAFSYAYSALSYIEFQLKAEFYVAQRRISVHCALG